MTVFVFLGMWRLRYFQCLTDGANHQPWGDASFVDTCIMGHEYERRGGETNTRVYITNEGMLHWIFNRHYVSYMIWGTVFCVFWMLCEGKQIGRNHVNPYQLERIGMVSLAQKSLKNFCRILICLVSIGLTKSVNCDLWFTSY